MSHIFISYSKMNSEYAYALADFLQEKGFNVWIDRIGIEYGVGWWDAIVEGLDTCAAFIVVMTPQAFQSPWVQREVFIVLDKKPIFPLLLDGDNWKVFVLTQYADVRGGKMPDKDLLKRLSQYIKPGGKGTNKSDLTPEKAATRPHIVEQFDVDMAIANFGKAFRAKRWSEALNILSRIRASGQDPTPFDPDEFENRLQKTIEDEKRRREQAEYEAERDKQYQRIVMMRDYAGKPAIWKALNRFWQTFPDYDPDNIGAEVRPRPKQPPKPQPTNSADAIRRIIGDPFEWCDVPAGEFIMGHKDESDNPPRKLTLPAFAIAKYPITYRQFEAFINAKDGFKDRRWWQGLAKNQSDAPGDQAWKIDAHPRERMSWYDAMAFCRWLSFKLGGGYDIARVNDWLVRLPTEFEWEKAARGTDGRIYPYGNTFDRYKGNTHESGIGQTTPVTQYPNGASPYGALDMSGNVWEWCLTDYHNPQAEATKENLSSSALRVLRGGAFLDNRVPARAVFRNSDDPFGRDYCDGFRVLCVRPPSL